MHQTWKKCAGVFLALTLTAASLAGCGNSGNTSGSSSAASSQAGSSAAGSAVSSEAESSASASETGTGVYDYAAGLDENGYFEGVRALDYVKLPDYKSIEVPEETGKVSEEEVQAKVDSLFSTYNVGGQITDQEVKDGDTVNIDYVGSVDGVEFEGGTTNGMGTDVTIGVTQYIDDFLEQLIGHKPGETVNVNVTFPENYGKENLNGKDALFVTKINYIQGEAKYTEANDEFVAGLLKDTYGWSTLAEMKAGVEEDLRMEAVGEYLLSQIREKAEISEMPQQLVDYYQANMRNYYETMAKQSGVEMEEYLEQQGIASEEELLEKNQEALKNNEEVSLVLQAVCEELGLKATDSDVAAFFRDKMSTDDYSQYEEVYGMPYLRMMSLEGMAKKELAAAL